MKTAVVILNWNGQAMMERYLPTVVKYTEADATVIVADNASTDGSLELLRQSFPSVGVVVLDKNYGFAEGYNRALQQVEADYYVLLNSDVEVTDGWLRPMIDYLDTHPQVAACQPKLLAVADKASFEYAGACGGYIDKYGYPFCRGRVFDTVEKDHGQYDTAVEVAWTTGACMVVRSSDYWSAGGLDGRFFAHNEEIDLCWRLRLSGRQLFCLPQCHVYHVGGGTLPQGNPRKTYLNFRNNLTMLYKNLPEAELGRVMFVRTLLDYVAAFETLLVGRNIGDFKAILKARRDFKRWRSDFQKEREQIQRCRVGETDTARSGFSLLWQYYVRGRKTFDRLPLNR